MIKHTSITAALNFAQDMFSLLDMHWQSEQDGMLRPGYSAQETEAMDEISRIASEKLGMSVYQDAAGNRYMIHEADGGAVRMAGSHVDAVPKGGRFDGPAGVVTPLAALSLLKAEGNMPRHPVCVAIWRNEESPWFGQFGVGSKLATGRLGVDFVHNAKGRQSGNTLAQHMENLGLDVSALGDTLTQRGRLIPIDAIESLVETHIEQNNMLETAGKQLGIVNAIRGNLRFPDMIEFYGKRGHSGAVQQSNRRDAMAAVGEFIHTSRRELTALAQQRDAVFAYVQGGVVDGSATSIAELAAIQPEVRSTDPQAISDAYDIFTKAADIAARETSTQHNFASTKVVRQDPVEMSADICAQLEEIAQEARISTMTLPSGAGHDAAVVAQAGVPSSMIFLRHGREGVSHDPAEMLGHEGASPYHPSSDFAAAIELNARWLSSAARDGENKCFISLLDSYGVVRID